MAAELGNATHIACTNKLSFSRSFLSFDYSFDDKVLCAKRPSSSRAKLAELYVCLKKLPCLLDRPQLPYIEALEKESLRWNNVIPVGQYLLIMTEFIPRALPFSQTCLMFYPEMIRTWVSDF